MRGGVRACVRGGVRASSLSFSGRIVDACPQYVSPTSDDIKPHIITVDALPMKRRKTLAGDVWIILQCIPALFMTSLTQTAGREMAALTVEFLRLSYDYFSGNRTKNYGLKNCCLFIVCPKTVE